MNLETYQTIGKQCDAIMDRRDAGLVRVAIPWLHLLNEHPLILENYIGLPVDSYENQFTNFPRPTSSKSFWKDMVKATIKLALSLKKDRRNNGRSAQFKKIFNPRTSFGVLIVTNLVNRNHLKKAGDFYYGNIPDYFSSKGVKLVYINQTGNSNNILQKEAVKHGNWVLMDTLDYRTEYQILYEALLERRKLRDVASKADTALASAIAERAADLCISQTTLNNLRIHEQIFRMCKAARPKMVMALHEGHAWERCVWHAAKSAQQETIGVGFQHTILWRHAHSIKRSIRHDGGYNPDIILTIGDITRKRLENSQGLKDVQIITSGTHRSQPAQEKPTSLDDSNGAVLVLPEGIEDECIFLFSFAVECARREPLRRYIFRTHPIISFESVREHVLANEPLPENVLVSEEQDIQRDFEKAAFIMYRGSSTALYGILAGLQPVYIRKEEDIEIDQLYEIELWRTSASSVRDFVDVLRTEEQRPSATKIKDWEAAKDYCLAYIKPINKTVFEMMARSIDSPESKDDPKGDSQ